jgi:hypothetical protein
VGKGNASPACDLRPGLNLDWKTYTQGEDQ